MNYAPAPYTPPDADVFRYEELQAEADTMVEAQNAEREMYIAYREMNDANGWFMGAEGRQQLAIKTRIFEEKKALYTKHNARRQEVRTEANKVVTIWSKYGLQATRDGFWKAFEKGKEFAKSMTWWDVMFAGFSGSRDREASFVVIILQWVLRVAMNFTIGFIYSFFNFGYNLFYIIADFAPDPASAFMYYVLAILAAFSMVMSVIIAMYGTIATVVVGGAYAVVSNQALEGGAQGQRQRLNQRQHYD